MGLPDILSGLLAPAAYPHACTTISLVETHISWVLLTGDYAYKIRKPVRLPFLDFSTLALRRHDCDEELRCNRSFAPELYLGIVPVRRDAQSCVTIDGQGEIIEWAVRMRQFPAAAQLDRLLAAGSLTTARLRAFGRDLGNLHERLPVLSAGPEVVAARVLAPVEETLLTLLDAAVADTDLAAAEQVARLLEQRIDTLRSCFTERLAGGFTRECHGDLHLGNLVLLDDRIVAFDCLEFDANLRWIDVQSDVAFLFMDCLFRERADLGYAFLDGYLDVTGDYAGLELLPFYTVYRALVRAKVAAIEVNQMPDAAARDSALARMRNYVAWAASWLVRGPATLCVMSGVSGSGKSFLAARLALALPAVRMRSDVARRGRDRPLRPADRGADRGRYAPERRRAVYQQLDALAAPIIAQGDSVILDATFLERAARRAVIESARARGYPVVVLHCSAPPPVLERRVRQRLAEGADASEADVAVLHRQLEQFEGFAPDEPVLEIDTSDDLDDARFAGILSAVRSYLATPD